jgi:hypothetical protein
MAAPITHIFQAETVYNKYFSDKSKKEFFIGTCFPDIRSTGVIAEEKTHFKNLSLCDLKNESSFWAGVKFHSIVDNHRKAFINEKNIYDTLPKLGYIKESLKLFEDEYFYQFVEQLPDYVDFMKDILSEELAFGIKEKELKHWHNSIINYLSRKPDNDSRTKHYLDKGFSKESINVINENLTTLRTDVNAISYCKDFFKYIIEL